MVKRAAIVTMVKDECDIIELFVKINAKVVDHVFVIDHDSKDGTMEILLTMKASGYPLTIFRHESADFQQPLMITSMVRRVAEMDTYDFIAALDADEFIHCGGERFADLMAAQIPPGAYGEMPWPTYVPVCGDYYASPAPLYDVFRKRSNEPADFCKVVVPKDVARLCYVSEGNHAVGIEGRELARTRVSAVVQHVPVRSPDQIIAKALLGSHRMSIKPGRKKEVGMHWDVMAEKIRKANYRLSREDMLELAFLYISEADEFTVDESAARVGSPDDRIELVDWSKINLTAKFDQVLSGYCAEIRASRGMTGDG